ncbi:hypothetical protein IB232_20250 [Pseudomonas sp. PDM15]|uniref:hypothetical protein n=1 Tax=Pseudomonas sp. PDM15 TaxID=2769303 RepID=UPI00177A8998|nr:hypothetical protein [Pseudomonas sp. PDM15]MBD9427675.1 hypothetical protein [Pseudomonas sp. PDM15]
MIRKKVWVISYGQLGLIVAVFAVGVIVALLLVGGNAKPPTTFTTTELIGFALSVVLSGASIVLAIAAIGLGRFSEQAIIQRSDESIRLQNEVFAKTTEALQRIESSTGVTEKRIEDIISGRVGDLSHTIAEIAAKGSGKGEKAREDLEREIKDSILKSLHAEGINAATESRTKIREREREREKERLEEKKKEQKRYQDFHDRVMLCLANKDDFKIHKAPAHGTVTASGEELFDAIFRKDNLKIGALTFRDDADEHVVKLGLTNGLSELRKGVVDLILLAMEKPQSDAVKAVNEAKALVAPEYKERFCFVACGDEPEAFLNAIDISADKIELKL